MKLGTTTNPINPNEMYTEHVSKIYLNKAKLKFFNRGQMLPFEALVEDYAELCYDLQNLKQYSPDFIIKGRFIPSKESQGRKSYGQFQICVHNPTHILGITGISNSSSLDKYRLKGTLFSSLWEQRNLSYLFQIIKTES